MGSIFYSLCSIAVAFWVGYFWYRVGRWTYLHGGATWRKAERLKNAIAGAYKGDV